MNKELVQEMCDIQDGLIDIANEYFMEVLSLIVNCSNKDIMNYAIKEIFILFGAKQQKKDLYIKLIHYLLLSNIELKEKITEIIICDKENHGDFYSFCNFNDILRRIYDYGDISLDQIDFENCSFYRIKYFADIVPYYSSFTKSVKLGETFEITKQLIYDQYYKDTIEYYVKNDDLENFSRLTSSPGFSIEKYKTNLSCFQEIVMRVYCNPNLANFAAFYGASKCFRYILTNAQMDKRIDEYYVISGGNAEIIHLCDEHHLINFEKSMLCDAATFRHKDILEWLIETKKIDFGDDLTEVDYLPNAAFIHYILNADHYHYDLSAMLFYCVERNYPLFVIQYLVSLGAAKKKYVFYRGPPFEVFQTAMDKAIENYRTDIIKYMKKIGIKAYESNDDFDDSEKSENNENLDETDNCETTDNNNSDKTNIKKVLEKTITNEIKFTKLWHENKFKQMRGKIKDHIFTSDAYEIRYMIDNYNFCRLKFDCFNENYIHDVKILFDEQANINFNKKNGMIDKTGKSSYDYISNGLPHNVRFENAWIYCEQAFDLFQKGKKLKDDSLCELARNHIIDKMKDRFIEDGHYGKDIWRYF